MLEDIFVLLFLRSEDFCEDKSVDECSPDECEDLVPPGRCVIEDVAERITKSASLPSPLRKSSSSYLRTLSSSSSYPSSSQRKLSSQSRQNIKVCAITKTYQLKLRYIFRHVKGFTKSQFKKHLQNVFCVLPNALYKGCFF